MLPCRYETSLSVQLLLLSGGKGLQFSRCWFTSHFHRLLLSPVWSKSLVQLMLLLFNLLLQSSVDRASGHPVVNKQRKEEKKKKHDRLNTGRNRRRKSSFYHPLFPKGDREGEWEAVWEETANRAREIKKERKRKKKPLRIINDVERNGIGRDLLELSQNCRHDAAIKEKTKRNYIIKIESSKEYSKNDRWNK